LKNRGSLDELGHGADNILDRNLAAQAMAVVKIDAVDTKALETPVASFPDILRLVPDLSLAGFLVDRVGELGSQEDLDSLYKRKEFSHGIGSHA
jgi:hypothetical protein